MAERRAREASSGTTAAWTLGTAIGAVARHDGHEEAAMRRAPFAATAIAFDEIEIVLDKQTQSMTSDRWYLQPRMLGAPRTAMELGMPGAEAHVREGLGSSEC